MSNAKAFKSTFGSTGSPRAVNTRRPAKRKSAPRAPAAMNGHSGPSRLDLIREKHATHVNGNGAIDPVKRGRMEVSIDKLIEDPKNERKTYRDMEGLIESVKANGVLEPITVTPAALRAGGSYMIVFGHRRYRAAKAAGLKTVEVLIRDPEDDNTRRVKSIVSNVQRENVGPVELAESLAELVASGRYATQRKLAETIGRDETWVSGLLGVLKLPSPLRHKLETSQVSIPYDAAIQIARVTEPALQNALVETAIKGATVREIRKQISEAKPKPASTDTHFQDDEEIDRSTFEIVDQSVGLYSITVARRGNGRWTSLCWAKTCKNEFGSRDPDKWVGSYRDRIECIGACIDDLDDFASSAQGKREESEMAQIRGAMQRLTSKLQRERQKQRAAQFTSDRQFTTERDPDEAQSSRSAGTHPPSAPSAGIEPSPAAPAHDTADCAIEDPLTPSQLGRAIAVPGGWIHHMDSVGVFGVAIQLSSRRRLTAEDIALVCRRAAELADKFRQAQQVGR